MNRSGFTVVLAASASSITMLVGGRHWNTLDGVYTVPTGQVTLEFKSGKAYLTTGASLPDPDGMPYAVKGGKIILHKVPSAGGMFAGDMTLTRNPDGTITSDFGMLKKKAS